MLNAFGTLRARYTCFEPSSSFLTQHAYFTLSPRQGDARVLFVFLLLLCTLLGR